VNIPCRCQVPHAGACPVRISRLKLIARSPAHYAAATVEETLAMEVGSSVHSMVLGGPPVIAWTKLSDKGNPCPRRGKDYEAFEADNPGAIILTPEAFNDAHAIAEAVKADPLAMAALDGDRELEAKWRFGTRTCGGRIDAVPFDGVTELKVSRTSNPTDFIWHALRMGWLAQDVWYLDGLAAGGRMLEHARIVAVEPKPPFAVTTFKLTAQAIDQARRTYRAWFERLLVCEDCDEWPAYAQNEVELDVPDNDVALDFGDAEAA
jgi:hypothetical protein